MNPKDIVMKKFAEHFGNLPSVLVRAPGRVNLIGEHTDYNDGFVLPMAIDRSTWIALRPRSDNHVVIHASDLDASGTFDLNRLVRGKGWLEYVKGVAWALQEDGYELNGWDGVVSSNVPAAAGLSSSAALELATARAFHAVSNFTWDPVAIALAGQRAENAWVGVSCGIMDQLISATGMDDHAVLIDCRTLERDEVPLPRNTTVLVLDTGTRRGLVDSTYNKRREDCEAVAHHLGVDALRDVTLKQLEASKDSLDPTTFCRARHVVSENKRTLTAAEALKRGDSVNFGLQMNSSHESLRHNYAVSSKALDTMVSLAQPLEGCYGARMTGAGFGGAAVALVESDEVDSFVRNVEERYQKETRIKPAIYVCRASKGASVEVL
jgi:galactokinase